MKFYKSHRFSSIFAQKKRLSIIAPTFTIHAYNAKYAFTCTIESSRSREQWPFCRVCRGCRQRTKLNMQIDKVAQEDLPDSPASSSKPRRRNTTMEAEKPRFVASLSLSLFFSLCHTHAIGELVIRPCR